MRTAEQVADEISLAIDKTGIGNNSSYAGVWIGAHDATKSRDREIADVLERIPILCARDGESPIMLQEGIDVLRNIIRKLRASGKVEKVG